MLQRIFFKAPMFLMGTLMLAGIALISAAVVSRYLFGKAIFWAEEVLVFMNIWGVLLGLVAITWRGEHLNMDLFSSRLSGLPRRVLNGAVVVVLVLCCGFVAVQSWKIVGLFAQGGQVSVGAGIPKAIPHAALVAGFGLAALAGLLRLRAYVKGAFGTGDGA